MDEQLEKIDEVWVKDIFTEAEAISSIRFYFNLLKGQGRPVKMQLFAPISRKETDFHVETAAMLPVR